MKKAWRRRVIRLLGWAIGAFASLTAIVLLTFAIYLLFTDYPETLRQTLEEQLSEVAGAPAEIRAINLDLARFAFELRDVSVQGAEGEQPLLELERVWGRLRPSDILRMRLHWTDLIIEGLSLRIVETEEAGLRLSRGPTPSPSLASVGLSADRISVEESFLVLDNEKVPWRLEASNLALAITRSREHEYRGTLRYENGRLKFREHPDVEASVEAEFQIAGQELYVNEAHLASDLGEVRGRGKASFAGGLRGGFDLEAEGESKSVVAYVLGIARHEADVRGPVTFRGRLDLSPDNTLLQGTAVLRSGRMGGLPVADWTAELFWDRTLLQVSYARGTLAGGSARFQLNQPLPAVEHPASLDIDLAGASLPSVLLGIRGRETAIESELSGEASLVLDTPAIEPIEGNFVVRGTSPAGSGGEERGISFEARGQLRRSGVEIETASFNGNELEATLSGVYPREGPADMTVDVVSSDLSSLDWLQREVRHVLRSDAEDEPTLFGLAGRGRATGRLTGRLPHLVYEGELVGETLVFQGLPLGTIRTRGRLSRSQLTFEDLVARYREGAMAGEGRVALTGPLRVSDFDLDVRLASWPSAELGSWAGLPEVSGGLTGDISAKRLRDELDGSASLAMADGSLYRQPFDGAEGKLRFEGSSIVVDSVVLRRDDAVLEGRFEIDLDHGGISGSVDTSRFPFETRAFGGLLFEGQLEGRAEVAGRMDAPFATLTARTLSTQLAGVALGEGFVSGELRSRRLELEATLEKHASELAVELTAILEDDHPVTGRARWRELDTGPWLALASETLPETVQLLTDGEASFETELHADDTLGALTAVVSVGNVVLEGESSRFLSERPVDIRIGGGELELSRLELVRGDSRVGLEGLFGLEEKTLDFAVEGVVGLGILESFYPSFAASGDVDLEARISGSWARPSLAGHADFKGGSVSVKGFPQALGGLTGRVVFDNRTVRVPALEGVFGSGPVRLSGALSLEELRPGSVDLNVRGSDIRLRYPEGLVATLDTELSLLGSAERQVLSGTVTLTDAVWTREYDLVAGILSDSEGFQLFEEFASQEVFQNLRFDITIVAPPESLRVRNSLAAIDASAELELRGSLDEPVLLGSSEANRGEVFFLGQRYDITAGKVDFVDPTKVEPFIELTAETRVRSYRVELRLTGTPDRFYPELRSDPPLRTVDILRLLAGATERDILVGTEEEELAGVGVASLLTERLSQEVGKRAERLFGLDRFSIDPFLIGQFANPTARVSLGKQITRELSINYSTNLNATTEAIILIEYTPRGPMSWILSRDEEGDVGIDVKFRKSF